MPQDALTLNLIRLELKSELIGSKINKILQPENDEINLILYTKTGNQKLAISSNPSSPRCHLTTVSKENPLVAPNFCMLLRKHIQGGIINDISQPEFERIFDFEIISKNELNDNLTFHLVVELMGRYSNIFLLNSEYKILGSINQNNFDLTSKRSHLVGMKYILPPKQGTATICDADSIKKLLANYSGNDLVTYLNGHIIGSSFLSINEILHNSKVSSSDTLSQDNQLVVLNEINIFKDKVFGNNAKPCLSIDNNVPKDFFIYPYNSITTQYKPFDSLNAALDYFYSVKDTKLRINEKSKHYKKIVKNAISRCEKKLVTQLNQLEDCKDCEKNKLYGELLTANIYKIKQNDESVEVFDYYNNKTINIKLDTGLTGAKNAQKYYKKYAKQKRTIENVTEQIKLSKAQLYRFQEILSCINRCESEKDIHLIKDDLIKNELIKAPLSKGSKGKKQKEFSPLSYVFDNWKIFVGRNSSLNDFVTFKLAKDKDLWLHVKGFFGSHTIIIYDGREFSDEVILKAAEIAAYYSDCKDGTKIEVDYTLKKNISRPAGTKAGFVTFSTNKSIVVNPNCHKELLILES